MSDRSTILPAAHLDRTGGEIAALERARALEMIGEMEYRLRLALLLRRSPAIVVKKRRSA
jgi:hypothetical protein